MKKQSGFTLIELMIVVAIVGILAALALPAYQDYIARSKMSEVLAELAESKTSIAEFVASNSTWPNNMNQAGIGTQSGYVEAMTTAGSNVGGTVAIGDTYDIVIELNDTINTAVDDDFIRMRATALAGNELEWQCMYSDAADFKYVPSNCRNLQT
jgi:type IV pilus assembly protein PilA